MDTELDRRRRYRYAQILEASKDQRKNPVKQACEVCCDVNIVLYGLQTIQGFVGSEDSRILLTGQTVGSENGIWLMRTNAWIRAYDADTKDSLENAIVAVKRGTYEDTLYLQTADDIIVDTTALTWISATSDAALQGPQGVPGPKGDTGDTGPQGIPGITDWGGITGDINNQLDLKAALEVIPQAHVQGLTVSDNANFNSIVFPTGSGKGLLIDPLAPTFGWKDLIGQLTPRASGAPAPALSAFRGVNILSYAFQAGDKIDHIVYHIPHDYAVGTDLHLHIHWGHNGTAISGSMIIAWDIMYAKGHQQDIFNSELRNTQTIVTPSITTVPRWQHRIDELQLSIPGGSVSQLDTNNIEVDGLLFIALTVTQIPVITGGSVNQPFLFTADIHYQSTQMSTKNKTPNFYT